MGADSNYVNKQRKDVFAIFSIYFSAKSNTSIDCFADDRRFECDYQPLQEQSHMPFLGLW